MEKEKVNFQGEIRVCFQLCLQMFLFFPGRNARSVSVSLHRSAPTRASCTFKESLLCLFRQVPKEDLKSVLGSHLLARYLLHVQVVELEKVRINGLLNTATMITFDPFARDALGDPYPPPPHTHTSTTKSCGHTSAKVGAILCTPVATFPLLVLDLH